jgi:chromosome partitioning protein
MLREEESMGKIIAVGNQKGGVGKSTTVYNLGVCMAQRGKTVLMVDMDVQSSLTQACGMDPMAFKVNITALFEDKPAEKIADAVYDLELGLEGNLHIICSTPMLASVELSLTQARNREFRLRKALQYIKDAYDFILIDCMPSLSLLTINSLSAADYLVVPAGCSRLDHYAFELFMQTCEGIIEDLNPDLKILGTVATLFDCRATEDREVLAELKENHNLLCTIPRTTEAKKYVKKGIPVVLGKPNAKISHLYQDLTDKIITMVEEDK